MRLNLGGGDQKIPGYTNVDLCGSADVRHDLRERLPFEENSCEHLLAIHVIESFNRWEMDDILRDWYRVLMPESCIDIEFTVLSDTINMYLNPNPTLKQRGHWGLYGRQDIPIDPIVLHHYVYEIDELEALLKRVGFTNISFTREGINHVPERDCRVKAYK